MTWVTNSISESCCGSLKAFFCSRGAHFLDGKLIANKITSAWRWRRRRWPNLLVEIIERLLQPLQLFQYTELFSKILQLLQNDQTMNTKKNSKFMHVLYCNSPLHIIKTYCIILETQKHSFALHRNQLSFQLWCRRMHIKTLVSIFSFL